MARTAERDAPTMPVEGLRMARAAGATGLETDVIKGVRAGKEELGSLRVDIAPLPRVPDLEVVDGAVDDDVAVEPGVQPQLCRDRQAPLGVRGNLECARGPHSCDVALGLALAALLQHRRGPPVELLRGPHAKAPLGQLGQEGCGPERVPEPCGQDDAAFGVERVGVGPPKARLTMALDLCVTRSLRHPPWLPGA